MRILKFLGVFLALTILIFGFVVGWNWKAFTIFFENRKALMEGTEWVSFTNSLEGLSEYMGRNPGHTSLASVVVNHPDSSIYYREDTPRVMGTTANFFILLAYSMQFDSGKLSPNATISWSDVSQYQLPDVEESIHNETFKIALDRGWVENGLISLENALDLLAQFNDLALADYLWWQLERSIWIELSDSLQLSETDMPLPYSGLYQAISPGLNNMENEEIIKKWRSEGHLEWRNHVIELSNSYAHDPDFRNEVQDYMSRNRLGNTFMEERDAMILFPKSTAGEMVGILQKIAVDSLVNRNVSRDIKRLIEWPMEIQARIEQDFTSYGALYDNRMGLMNGIDIGTSAYTGDTTVQALFLDQLPIAFWFHASGSHMHQDFMQRLIYDPAMIDQMNRVVEN